MSNKGTIFATNLARKKGSLKTPVPKIIISPLGVKGDVHAGVGLRQVSLFAQEQLSELHEKREQKALCGAFTENLTTKDLDLSLVKLLDRFRIGPVILEVTQVGKKCHGPACPVFQENSPCGMSALGIFCLVMQGGTVKAGDPIVHVPRVLKILIITLSDRASQKIYEDRSGPLAKTATELFAREHAWQLQLETLLLPDDATSLRTHLKKARDDSYDVIFTLGGTGLGTRDITPETVAQLCDKQIPGIMEHIRQKYAAKNPRALLSRTIVGIAKNTFIYTLPGSPKAVSEYLTEIFVTLEHALYMLKGLDAHG
jgi:molybdenum cofactor synthesis domain-containing protein